MLSKPFIPGINYIDTSPWYKASEGILGEVLPHISRNKYVISSKCGRKYSDDVLEWCVTSYFTFFTLFSLFTIRVNYSAHNNKWNFYVVRASLNVCARVAKSSIYFCENETLLYHSDVSIAMIANTILRNSLKASFRFDFSYDNIRESINKSIQKLGCKYLDICFCHDIEFAPTVDVLLSESLPAMQDAKDDGKIKLIGISGTFSNFLEYILRYMFISHLTHVH